MGSSRYTDLRGTRTEHLAVNVPAATATATFALLDCPHSATIESVQFIAGIAHAGHAANTKNINIDTRNSSFAVPSEVAARDYGAGTNDAAADVVDLWTPTGTAGDIAANGYLSAEIELVGTGLNLVGTFVTKWRVRE